MASMTEEFHRALVKAGLDDTTAAKVAPATEQLARAGVGPGTLCPCTDWAPDTYNPIEYDDGTTNVVCSNCGHHHPEDTDGAQLAKQRRKAGRS